VSVLERENIILRHWAGVLPATRVLLGRGPTGCDTTKPLIADENDAELQLVMDDSSPPRDPNWPQTPSTAVRTTFAMDPQQQQQQQPQQQHQHISEAQYEKGPGYDQPYPELQRFKPHPLYSHRPLDAYIPPPPQSHFDQNSSNIPTTDRILIKRESIYATPTTSALVPQAPSQQQQQQTPPNHPSIPHGSGFYVPHRPSYASQPVDRYASIHADPSQAMYTPSTWSDPYLHQPQTPVQGNRRPHPTLMTTPLMPSAAAGPSSGSVSSSSPVSQSANHPNADRGNTSMNGGAGVNGSGNGNNTAAAAAADPIYAAHTHRPSMPYAFGDNGSAVNLSNLSGHGNNGSQINISASTASEQQNSMTPSGYLHANPSSSVPPFSSYHSMGSQEATSGDNAFR
jgi:hypothetical protein